MFKIALPAGHVVVSSSRGSAGAAMNSAKGLRTILPSRHALGTSVHDLGYSQKGGAVCGGTGGGGRRYTPSSCL